MDLGIKGKVALVTGGSRGLGRESALALAREGVLVAICARGEDRLKETTAELASTGVKARGYMADLGDAAAPARLLGEVERDLGQVDILVNNVGGSMGTRDALSASEDDFIRVIDLNLWSTIRLMKLAVPKMQARKWGRVINISSIYGRELGGPSAPYMTAKASVIAVTKHLAITVAKDGVTVNSVAPGSIMFPGGGWEKFVKNSPKQTVDEFIVRNLPMGKFGWPEPVGAAVAFLASRQADLIVGACINVDGGQSHNLF
jgi:3-oxoacyl-[acyl-carrier protein] reductase